MSLKNVGMQKEKYDAGYFFNLEKQLVGLVCHWHKGCKKIQLIYAMKAVVK